jgi:lambda family phage portal protein
VLIMASKFNLPSKKTVISHTVQNMGNDFAVDGSQFANAQNYAGGATTGGGDIAGWAPSLMSADRATLPSKNGNAAKAFDLTRTTGYGAGALQSIKDNTVGSSFWFQSTPDYKLLGLDFDAANEWGNSFERIFSLYWNSTFVDAARKRTGTQILRDALGYQVLAGESFLVKQWVDNLSGFSTCWSLVEPERVGNPNGVQDDKTIRAGIKHDQYGAPISYTFRRKHPNDINSFDWSDQYDVVSKYSALGHTQVIHTFDGLANQSRGISKFSAVIEKFKLIDQMSQVEMSAATLAASRPLVIKSDHGPESAFAALRENSNASIMGAAYKSVFDMKKTWIENKPYTFQGARVTHLFGGEELQAIPSQYPHSNFVNFHSAQLREVARGLGMSVENLTGNLENTSYSSGRLANEVSYQSTLSFRKNGVEPIAEEIKDAFAREMFAKGVIEAPAGVGSPLDSWVIFKGLMRGNWIGAAKVQIDPTKTAAANRIMLETGELTLADIAAQNGSDWQEQLEQRARELKKMGSLSIPAPVAYNIQIAPIGGQQ